MISLIVLAAGLSTRFGRNKLLEKAGGITIIERVIRSAILSIADEVVVVLGYEAEKIKEALKGYPCKFVFNANFMIGQSSSVKAGVQAVMSYAEAVVILPGDIVLITPTSINAVIEEYKRCKSPIVVASHKGFMGHPILFDKSLFNEIMKIGEETMGLKALINLYNDKIKKVEVHSDEVLIDVDTQEDLLKILQHLQ